MLFRLFPSFVDRTPLLSLSITALCVAAINVLDVPPLRLASERLEGLKLTRLTPVDLSAAEVDSYVAWTAHVLSLMEFDDTSLFPSSTKPWAAMLFQPSPFDLGLLPVLQDQSQWAKFAPDDDWPVNSRGEPLVLLGSEFNRGRASVIKTAYLPSSRVVCSELGLAQFATSDVHPTSKVNKLVNDLEVNSLAAPRSTSNAKGLLQDKIFQYVETVPMRSYAKYGQEQIGEQLWVGTVSFTGVDGTVETFRGEQASRKKDSQQVAAQKALAWIEQHWGAAPAAPRVVQQGGYESLPVKHQLNCFLMMNSASAATYKVEEIDLEQVSSYYPNPANRHDPNLAPDKFVATVSPVALDELELPEESLALAPALPMSEVRGEPARSKQLAIENAARAALDEWLADYSGKDLSQEDLDRFEEFALMHVQTIQSLKQVEKLSKLVVPLSASQWRGASCAVLVARMLGHSMEICALHSDLATLVRPEVLPSLAQLRTATTAAHVNEHSNELISWLGSKVLSGCCKAAAVVALRQHKVYDTKPAGAQRQHKVYDICYHWWTSPTQLSKQVSTRGWDNALLVNAWSGSNGVTRGKTSTFVQNEMMRAVIGSVFLRSFQQYGIDQAMADAWSLSSTMLLHSPQVTNMDWNTLLAELRVQLGNVRPARDARATDLERRRDHESTRATDDKVKIWKIESDSVFAEQEDKAAILDRVAKEAYELADANAQRVMKSQLTRKQIKRLIKPNQLLHSLLLG